MIISKAIVLISLLVNMSVSILRAGPTELMRDKEIISNLVTQKYSSKPLIMKGEFFRNWSHTKEPVSIHLSTSTIMGRGLLATIVYEHANQTMKMAHGVVLVNNEVIELRDSEFQLRYQTKDAFGLIDSEYKHACSIFSALQSWNNLENQNLIMNDLESYPEYFINVIAEANTINKFLDGWGIFVLDQERIEELDILHDGTIEVWRSRSAPGAKGTHSSLERQYKWLDSPVDSKELQTALATWSENPTLESLEKLILGYIDESEKVQKDVSESENEVQEVELQDSNS